MAQHSPLPDTDTICAVATPPGRGGVGIVRLSGPASLAVAQRLFRPHAGAAGLRPYQLRHGVLQDPDGALLDDILAVFMAGPRSFTGEDVVEFHCHGSPLLLERVLAAICACGARPARAGEFSYRAYIHGRLDLAQAEAVAELVAAPAALAADQALARLSGLLSQQVAGLRQRLEELRQALCLAVDFPEDEVECLPPEAVAAALDSVRADLVGLLADARRGRLARDGARVVLAGAVNAGKSSLLNALLGRARALVDAAPGTTRDWLEESADLAGLPVRLVDTAGLRRADNAVELAGVAHSRDLVAAADLVLLVVDQAAPLPVAARELASALGPERALVVANKADLPPLEPDTTAELAGLGFVVIRVAARTGQGLEELAQTVARRLGLDQPASETVLAPNQRQADSLARALAELEALARELAEGLPPDVAGVRLELACSLLAEVCGVMTPQDVLDGIFSRFCIGK